jgi:hypothetical protein
MTTNNFFCKTDESNPVKQEVNGTVILPPLVFPALDIVLPGQSVREREMKRERERYKEGGEREIMRERDVEYGCFILIFSRNDGCLVTF